MKGYIDNLICLSILCGVIGSFFRSDSKIKRCAYFSVSVMLVYIVLSPFSSVVEYIRKFNDWKDITLEVPSAGVNINTEEWILESTDMEIRTAVSQIARSRYNIPLSVDNISLDYDTGDFENVIINKITVETKGIVVISNINEFCYYISDMFMCECEVDTG